jgi:hypothetical protein
VHAAPGHGRKAPPRMRGAAAGSGTALRGNVAANPPGRDAKARRWSLRSYSQDTGQRHAITRVRPANSRRRLTLEPDGAIAVGGYIVLAELGRARSAGPR